jgi:hypothetical protein
MTNKGAQISAHVSASRVLGRSARSLTSVLLGAQMALLLALSACGASTGPGSTAHSQPPSPDNVRIEIAATAPLPGGTFPVVTLSDAALVRQLYATIYALPTSGAAAGGCTRMAGPSYTLTFRQGTAPLVTVQADYSGCRTVTIVGATPVRQWTSAFGEQLQQAIVHATSPLRPTRLAIAVAPHATQTLAAPQSAEITTAAVAQQLYDAILALPLVSAGGEGCPSVATPTDQFVFFAGEQMVPACVDDTSQTVIIDGGYQWRGGVFTLTDQFRSQLRSILAGAKFAPGRPDQFGLTVTKGHTSAEAPVSDTQLFLALYDRIFTLPVVASKGEWPFPGCPPDADKVAGTGVWTRFTFTQWDLLLMRIDTYEGSCRFVQEADTGQGLKSDQAFWDLVHRALGT